MEERASELLALSDHVLFAHGGCHVFALSLRKFSGLPLLRILEVGGTYNHLACNPGNGCLLDFFGLFTHAKYVREENLDGRDIQFAPITEEEVKKRFIVARGPGYYAHPDFFVPATERAHAWIVKHRAYFDGTKKIAIPDLRRTTTASDNTKIVWPAL